jgi:hypothetical protein
LQVRRVRRERIGECGERIDERAGRGTRPRVRIQLLARSGDGAGPVVCSGDASTRQGEGLSKGGKENAGCPR